MQEEQHRHETRVSTPVLYVGIGLLLGFAAPIGALLMRLIFIAGVSDSIRRDLEANRFFYLYTLIGTCVVFAAAAWIAGRRAQRLRELEAFYHERSEIDGLTGLLNAAAFRDRYQRALDRAARSGTTITLLLLDVDHLKRINDEYGHQVGSAALRHVADAIRASKRAADDAARWGGDEFAILFEDAGPEIASRVGETIVEALRTRYVATRSRRVPVAVSGGIAFGIPAGGAEDLFAAADRALYEAKRKGRNRVVVAE